MLNELDRLERKATAGPWAVWRNGPDEQILAGGVVIAEVGDFYLEATLIAAARNNLRPLLELVEQMGEALGKSPHSGLCQEVDGYASMHCQRCFALDAYQRAKGGSDA